MAQSTKPISPLRQRMIEDMRMRKLSTKTQSQYIRAVANFTRFLTRSPDTADAEDLRRFQLHLVEQGVSTTTINATISGLKMFFNVTLDRPEALKSTRQLNRAFHFARKAAEIDKRVSLHSLRHAFATHLLEQHEDIRLIQVLLGHQKIENTARYTQVATNLLREVRGPLEYLDLRPPG